MSNQPPDHRDAIPADAPSSETASGSARTSTSDPLASLYKMSRTAGLGSTEYVAVNATAVVALLLGLASAAAVLGTILLIIPILAIVVGFVALRQINNSAGTETGKGLAILGMVLALLFAGVVGGQVLRNRSIQKQEQGKIVALIDRLGQAVKSGDYEQAWNLFSDRFHQTTLKEDFIAFWVAAKTNPSFGPVQGMRAGLMEVEMDETGTRQATAQVIIQLERAEVRPLASFRKVGDDWYIDSIQIQFKWRSQPQ